jgi:hypothetical protein
MKSHGSIREWYRGTGLRLYLSALNTKELHAFEEEILCVLAKHILFSQIEKLFLGFPDYLSLQTYKMNGY